ncbi:MAG: LptA/OstA family protein [Rhodospirillales bacterium]
MTALPLLPSLAPMIAAVLFAVAPVLVRSAEAQTSLTGTSLIQIARSEATPAQPAPAAPPAKGAPAKDATGKGASNPPIDIEAATQIEWNRTALTITARGNAKAVRGDLVVTGDTLTAHYRQLPDGSTDVWRLDGDGHVKVTTPTETAWGDAGTYEVDAGKLVLTSDPGGPRVRMVTGSSEVTARDRLDYLRPTRVLIAYGDALATEPGREMRGDKLTAYLTEGGGVGRQKFSSVDAVGNVDVKTKTDRITADRGRYNGTTDTASFTGQVQITSGDSVMHGCQADFDLRTGFNRLLPCPPGAGQDGRVRGVIVPSNTGQ